MRFLTGLLLAEALYTLRGRHDGCSFGESRNAVVWFGELHFAFDGWFLSLKNISVCGLEERH